MLIALGHIDLLPTDRSMRNPAAGAGFRRAARERRRPKADNSADEPGPFSRCCGHYAASRGFAIGPILTLGVGAGEMNNREVSGGNSKAVSSPLTDYPAASAPEP